jgi:hypothetical protein
MAFLGEAAVRLLDLLCRRVVVHLRCESVWCVCRVCVGCVWRVVRERKQGGCEVWTGGAQGGGEAVAPPAAHRRAARTALNSPPAARSSPRCRHSAPRWALLLLLLLLPTPTAAAAAAAGTGGVAGERLRGRCAAGRGEWARVLACVSVLRQHALPAAQCAQCTPDAPSPRTRTCWEGGCVRGLPPTRDVKGGLLEGACRARAPAAGAVCSRRAAAHPHFACL